MRLRAVACYCFAHAVTCRYVPLRAAAAAGTCSYMRLQAVICDVPLRAATAARTLLRTAIVLLLLLRSDTCCYTLLHAVACRYMPLHIITCDVLLRAATAAHTLLT